MKVLMINGSPRPDGNTSIALAEMEKTLAEEGVEVETVQVGNKDIRGCIACSKCAELGKCVFDDLVNEVAPKLAEADGLVVGTPVYYGSANATPIAFLDRLFYSTGSVDKTMKVGCAVAVARRGGIEATWDEVNKYFGISGMPIASGQYWNGVYGREKGEAAQDAEACSRCARSHVIWRSSCAPSRERKKSAVCRSRSLPRGWASSGRGGRGAASPSRWVRLVP